MTLLEKVKLDREAALARVKVLSSLEAFLATVPATAAQAEIEAAIGQILSLHALAHDKPEPVAEGDMKAAFLRSGAQPAKQDAQAVLVVDDTCDDCGEQDPSEDCGADQIAPAALPTAKEKPLSEDEIAEALDRDARGETYVAIAAALGRKAAGFNFTLAKLRREAEREAEAAESHHPETVRPEPQEASAPRGFTFVPEPGTPTRQKGLHATLNAIGYGEPWTPETDLRMAEILTTGGGVSGVVEALGVSRQAAVMRWRRLLPEASLAGQTALLAALRLRAEAYRAGGVQ